MAAPQYEYDRDELRRAMARAFSAGELSRFALRFKVYTDREGSIAGAASQLVRALAARDQLAELAAALEREKPNVDWPKPSRREAAAVALERSGSAEEGTRDALYDPYAPPPPSVASAPPAVAPPREPPPPSPADKAAAASVDGRRMMWIAAMVFAGGLTLGIGATVFAVMRSPAAVAESAAAPGGPVALALLAADELATSVAYISDVCDMADTFPSARQRLAESFRRCGSIDIPTRDGAAAPPRAQPTASVPQPRRPKPRRRERSIPLRRPSSSAACLDRCHRGHDQCKRAECGPEPTSANDYAAFQQCSARCVSRYSRCRLSCR